MAKVLKFKPKKNLYFKNLNIFKKWREERQKEYDKKVLFLFQEALAFFEDYHRARITKNNGVDFHPYEYALGKAVSTVANIVRTKKVEHCYKKRVEELRVLKVEAGTR